MSALCVDCNDAVASTEIRRRKLCNECYRKFVSSKILKRMDTYRFKNQVGSQKKRLLLPVSGGVSSLVLLHVLDAQVKKQLSQQNRTAYDLVIAHVVADEARVQEEEAWWKDLGAKYELHSFLEASRLSQTLELDTKFESDVGLLGFKRESNEDNQSFMDRILTTQSSVTARKDLKDIVLRRLFEALGKRNECESIVFGHSDSRLAALALAEVAKGRGVAVPNMLADGPSGCGINFNYPVRDIFLTELETFRQTLDANRQDDIFDIASEAEPAVSIRNTSIDSLLGTYISSQGEKYPSIMANVVRTASKLQTAKNEDGRICRLCMMPVAVAEAELCYGCARMKQDIRI